MYLTIEHNNRGNFEVSTKVIETVTKNIIATALGDMVKSVEINSEISPNDLLFLVVKLVLKSTDQELFNEQKLVKEIERAFFQTLSFKPRNIAIAYYK